MIKRTDIEIMAPVGCYESLYAAINAGANSVYFGIGRLNMRSASAANFSEADMEQIVEGITLEDGFIQADEVSYVNESKKEVGIEIHSGRNRIVRRMFEHLGYTVQKLDRVYYAGLTKKNLKRGAWRFLTKDEVMRLKTGQYE